MVAEAAQLRTGCGLLLVSLLLLSTFDFVHEDRLTRAPFEAKIHPILIVSLLCPGGKLLQRYNLRYLHCLAL